MLSVLAIAAMIIKLHHYIRLKRGYIETTNFDIPIRLYSFELNYKKLSTLSFYRFWFILCAILFYMFCISGGMYNIIRGNTYHYIDNNPFSYIQQDGHDQSLIEGYIMGSISICLSILLIWINQYSFKYVYYNDGNDSWITKIWKIFRWILSCFVSPLVCIILFVYIWSFFIEIYSRKNRSYKSGFVWNPPFLSKYLDQLPKIKFKWIAEINWKKNWKFW
jgi:hypothetical protein